MSSCRQRAGTAYRCVHEGTVMERHPLAANTDLRQHPAHDCLTGTRSLANSMLQQKQREVTHSQKNNMEHADRRWNFNDMDIFMCYVACVVCEVVLVCVACEFGVVCSQIKHGHLFSDHNWRLQHFTGIVMLATAFSEYLWLAVPLNTHNI